MFDALMTWDYIGELQVTDLSLKFFREFDQNIEVGTYYKGSRVYESLTYAITNWAERTLLFLADYTPDDYVLPMTFHGTTGEPAGPRGLIHSQTAVLGVYDAYNGLIPPSWAHGGRLNQELWNKSDTIINDYRNVGFGTDSQFRVACEAEEAEMRLRL
jgi:glucoamylase